MNLITVVLLTALSSKMPPMMFKARAADGTIYNGRVFAHRARRHFRCLRGGCDGSLNLAFNEQMSLLAVKTNGFQVNAEGTVTQQTSTVKKLVKWGVVYIAAQEGDDITDSIVTATGAGGKNGWKSKLVGLIAGGTVWLIQKGQDVQLKAGTILEAEIAQGEPK